MKIYIMLILLFASNLLSANNLFITAETVNNKQLKVTERAAMIVHVNNDLLLNRTKQFDIQLPNGIHSSVVFDRLINHANNRYSWFGHLQGQPQEQMILSSVDGFYAGSIYTKNAVFELTSVNKFQIRIAELATDKFPECEGGVEVLYTNDNQNLDSHVYQSKGISTTKIDVMVVYTPQARDAAGGVAAIEATAQAAVDAMNMSFSNSNVGAEATLKYTGIVNYNDTGDSSADLSWVRNDSAVNLLRDNHGADMVSLLVESMSGCGRGYVMTSPGAGFAGSAFQVTKRSCAVGNLSFAHEFGHNMGLEHNPEDSGRTPAEASYPWSFAHYHNGSYRTVMSYSSECTNGCSRRQYYSNPDIQFNGLDTGIVDERDNARTLEQTTIIVADFRPSGDILFDDGFE